MGEGAVAWGSANIARLLAQSHLARSHLAQLLCRLVLDAGGRLWEVFDAAVSHQLCHFLRHVLLVLYQNVLVFQVELSKLEI